MSSATMTPSTNDNPSASATGTKKGLIRRLQHGYGVNGSLFTVASNDESSSPLLGQQPEEQSSTKENHKLTMATNWTVTATAIAVTTARGALSYISSCQHGGQSRRRLRCCIFGSKGGSTSEGGDSYQQSLTSVLFCRSRSPIITMVSKTATETVNFMIALIPSSSSTTTSDDSHTATNTSPLGDIEEQIEERWQPTVLTSPSSILKQEILPLTTTRPRMVNSDEVTESTSSWSSFSTTPAKTSSPVLSSTNRKKNFVTQGEEKQHEETSSKFLQQQRKIQRTLWELQRTMLQA